MRAPLTSDKKWKMTRRGSRAPIFIATSLYNPPNCYVCGMWSIITFQINFSDLRNSRILCTWRRTVHKSWSLRNARLNTLCRSSHWCTLRIPTELCYTQHTSCPEWYSRQSARTGFLCMFLVLRRWYCRRGKIQPYRSYNSKFQAHCMQRTLDDSWRIEHPG